MRVALQVRAKNGLLQEFIEKMGWNQADFGRAIGVHPGRVYEWFNMRNFPRDAEIIQKVCTLVGKSVEEIFPTELREATFRQSKRKWTIYHDVDLQYMPFNKVPEIEYDAPTADKKIEEQERKELMIEALATLSPIEELVIKERFGLKKNERESTLEEIGQRLGLSKTRIAQIEALALRRIKVRICKKGG